jgi:chromosomal replication initiator protein
LTAALAAEVLQTFISDREEPVTIDRIQRVVCQHFDVTIDELKGNRRTQDVTMPRQIAMYLSRVLVNASSTHVGAQFKRDHSTVLSAEKKIDGLIKEGGEIYDVVERLTETIKGGSSDAR